MERLMNIENKSGRNIAVSKVIGAMGRIDVEEVQYAMNSMGCALRNLVSFVQFKKREKHSWRSITFSKIAGFILQLY